MLLIFRGVGVPLAALLGFRFHLNVVGFWVGLVVSAALQVVIATLVLVRFDWEAAVRLAQGLATAPTEESEENSGLLANRRGRAGRDGHRMSSSGGGATTSLPSFRTLANDYEAGEGLGDESTSLLTTTSERQPLLQSPGGRLGTPSPTESATPRSATPSSFDGFITPPGISSSSAQLLPSNTTH